MHSIELELQSSQLKSARSNQLRQLFMRQSLRLLLQLRLSQLQQVMLVLAKVFVQQPTVL